MAQQNIDFGTFPDDPSADAIRTAFNKVQNNFEQLFNAYAITTVTSVNKTPGAGITVSSPTGNVVISANLACLQVSTSSLSMGRGSNSSSNALITQSSQTLVIDIDANHVYSNLFADINNGLAILNGSLSSNANYQPNLTSFGNLVSLNVDGRANFIGSNTYISNVGNLRIPGGGSGFALVTDGAGNLSWSGISAGNGVTGGNVTEVQFQGSGSNAGKFAGNAGFTFDSANGLLQTPLLTVAGNTVSANFIGTLANGNSNISITNNSNITFTSVSHSTMVITDTGANIDGTANVSGNANVGNIGADQGIFATSANIPVIKNGNSNITIGANTTVSIFVAGNASAAISATATGANISGNIVTDGNISTTGTNRSIQANNFNITGAVIGNANVSTVIGNLGIRALSSTYTDNVAIASSTIPTGAIHAIAQPTLTASNLSVTYANAATFYIANSPANSGTTLITNPYSLYIANGNTYFGGGNNYIAGDLIVAGNTTYYNVTTFAVQDPIISLGGGPNGNALITNDGKDRGTALQYYTTTPVTAFMGWDTGNSEFSFGSNVSLTSDVVTYNSLGNVRGSSWLGNVDGSYANVTGNTFLSTASGNVGIGTASPSFKLEAQTAITVGLNGTNLVNNSAVGSAFTYSDPGTVAAGDGKAIAIGMNGRAKVYIAAVHNGTSKDGIDLTLWTTNGGVAAEAMRINNIGNVGIGTSSPSTQLHVASGTAAIRVDTTANASNNPEVQLTAVGRQFNVGVGGGTFATAALRSSYYIYDNTGSAYRMVIDSAGNVGIGNTAPTNTLSVTGTAYVSGNITANGYYIRSVNTGITANGSTQTQATALTTEINIVSTVTSGTGVRLPVAVAGTVVYVTNTSANSVVVYPQTSGQINNLGTNIGFTQGANATLQFIAPTTSQWYTVGATYA